MLIPSFIPGKLVNMYMYILHVHYTCICVVAHLIEHLPRTQCVVVSNPTQGSFFTDCSGCISLPYLVSCCTHVLVG